MPEITKDDRDEVAQLIQRVFAVSGRNALDYASIAVFLSDRAQWQSWVEKLSRQLEMEYWYRAYQGYGNRLSGAISAYGKTLGFGPYENGVVMAGFAAEAVFRNYVAGRLFWKDAVSANHGEYSHSIQWLAIAMAAVKKEGLSLGGAVPDLYKESIDYKSNKDFARPGTGGKITLWDFLVDCFNYGGEPDFESNIITKTARSPTALNSDLHGMDIWLGKHIKGRYEARGWGAPSNQPVSIKEGAAQKSQQKGYHEKEKFGADNFLYEYKRTDKTSHIKAKPVIQGLVGTLLVTSGKGWGTAQADKFAVVKWTSPSGGGPLQFGYGTRDEVQALQPGERKVEFDMVLVQGGGHPVATNFRPFKG